MSGAFPATAGLASASVFAQVVDWSSIVSAVVAVLVVLGGIWVAGTYYQVIALANRRRRSIGPAVRDAGVCASRTRFARACWSLLTVRVRSGSSEVRDELTWLSALSQVRQPETDLPHSVPVPVPFTFSDDVLAKGYSSSMVGISRGYEAYASSLRRRWLLRSAAGPLVAREYECATDTAKLLMRWASFEPISAHGNADGLRGMEVTLAPGSRERSCILVTWPDMTTARATVTFPAMGISYQDYRVVMNGSPSHGIRPEPADVRVVARPPGTGSPGPLSFDGVLPRWHGSGYRLELDRITGRQKLHLCVAETTYFALRATQAPEAAEKAGADALAARVLTLNLLAVDDEDFALLTRRSDYVDQAGRYTGTVSGNCELVSREGLDADLDPYGLPDLLGAVARETREELGLDLTPASQLATLGIIEISSETELSTHVLVATARLPGRASQFRVSRTAPDPVEGLWEVGDQLMTIDMGAALNDAAAGQRLVTWIRTSLELTPGGAGSLLLLLAARLELRQQQAERAKRNNRAMQAPPWTTRQLAEWLTMPMPTRPPAVGDLVFTHPLWK